MNHKRFKRSLGWVLAASGLFALSGVHAQSNAVTITQSGNRVFLEVNAQQLKSELDTLFNATTSASNTDWNTVLGNGANPGMDVDFSGYDAKGIEDLIATGTLNADSLTLNKDASITGRLTVSGVTTVNDSLKATGYVTFSDSLEVVRAVSIGQTLFVTGVTSLGDSLHVVGNVDLDAMLNVDGAATFGASLSVAGVTTLNDSLKVNGNAEITGTLGLDSLSVTDVINGQVNSLGNFTSDALLEGDSNLYFSTAERTLLASMASTLDSLIAVIDALGSGSSPSEGATSCGNPVTYQGYDYATVQIGNQCWFAENLRSENYSNGDPIENRSVSSFPPIATEGVQGIYANDNAMLATYGRLYNWYAVSDSRALCPSGWHVPSQTEATALFDFLGGTAIAGGKMKASASDTPAWNGSNSSGFSALPGGYIWSDGMDGYEYYEGDDGYWWTSTPDGTNGELFTITDLSDEITTYSDDPQNGKSVRCVQDASSTASVPTVVTSAASDVAEEAATLNGSIDSDGGDAVTASGFRWGQAANLSNAQDLAGSGTSGAFTGSLTGLTAGTTYYFTAFATNAEGTAYGDTLSFETTAAAAGFVSCGDNVTYQGYDYTTVQIGSQCWFAENLQSTSYNDESLIASGLDNAAWTIQTEGAVSTYDDNEANAATHGRLYNWFAVNSGKLCPTGWHVPSGTEWSTLSIELGGDAISGLKLKALSPDWDGTNESGFAGLPSGTRLDTNGAYANLGSFNGWWSTTGTTATGAMSYQLWSGYDELWPSAASKTKGFSVRCVQD